MGKRKEVEGRAPLLHSDPSQDLHCAKVVHSRLSVRAPFRAQLRAPLRLCTVQICSPCVLVVRPCRRQQQSVRKQRRGTQPLSEKGAEPNHGGVPRPVSRSAVYPLDHMRDMSEHARASSIGARGTVWFRHSARDLDPPPSMSRLPIYPLCRQAPGKVRSDEPHHPQGAWRLLGRQSAIAARSSLSPPAAAS